MEVRQFSDFGLEISQKKPRNLIFSQHTTHSCSLNKTELTRCWLWAWAWLPCSRGRWQRGWWGRAPRCRWSGWPSPGCRPCWAALLFFVVAVWGRGGAPVELICTCPSGSSSSATAICRRRRRLVASAARGWPADGRHPSGPLHASHSRLRYPLSEIGCKV